MIIYFKHITHTIVIITHYKCMGYIIIHKKRVKVVFI